MSVSQLYFVFTMYVMNVNVKESQFSLWAAMIFICNKPLSIYLSVKSSTA